MPTSEAGIAIVGGPGLVSEVLSHVLSNSGSRVLGSYLDIRDLEAAMDAGGETPRAAVVDAEDPSAGPEAVSALRRSHPELKLILLCETLSPAVVHSVVLDSVEGVVMKSDGPQEVILALRHVLDGRAVMPAGWYQAALGTDTISRSLSEREREVLELAAAGMSNAEIAEKLVVSTNTIKYHLREIYSSLGVHNRVQASQLLNPDLNSQLEVETDGAEQDVGRGADSSGADPQA